MRRTFWQWLACTFGAHDVNADEQDVWLRCERPNCRWIDI